MMKAIQSMQYITKRLIRIFHYYSMYEIRKNSKIFIPTDFMPNAIE